MTQVPGGEPSKPSFDPEAEHMRRPKLRAVRGFPLQAKNQKGETQTLLGLADAQQISSKIVATAPAVQALLPHLDGGKGLDEIVGAVGRGLTLEFLQNLVAQLDDAGLLEGPTFEVMLEQMRRDFDSGDVLPPSATAQFADALVVQKVGQEATEEQKAELGPEALRGAMDAWIDQALKDEEQPSFDVLPLAVVAPHVDYPRGWLNYAHAWGRMRVVDRPDRVVILGTNHFGQATGVCGCDKGFESPLGVCPLDSGMLEAVQGRLGAEASAKLMEHRYDHEREHSIELHIPWIQHCLGEAEGGGFCPVFAALVHDPAVNNGESYDGRGVAMEPFVEALRGAMEEVGGRTLVVSSADLSHCGPAFGDRQSLAGEGEEAAAERGRIANHDREMIGILTENRPDDLVASMAWQQNPTRWCSVGNIVAAMKTVRPERVELLKYMAAMDQQGTTLVSHAALAMW